ncbi:hypothetical protein GBA52_015456 [Prunus armeniaca]|nr:hypothetical protein GBA52_015456 [Prunus armeniaca]
MKERSEEAVSGRTKNERQKLSKCSSIYYVFEKGTIQDFLKKTSLCMQGLVHSLAFLPHLPQSRLAHFRIAAWLSATSSALIFCHTTTRAVACCASSGETFYGETL